MTSTSSWTAADRAALAGLVVACVASLAWLVHPWFDPVYDAGLYVLTAKSLAAGEGYTHLGMPFVVRPPGFPAMLAPLVAWRGVDFHALNLLVAACGVAGVALLFAHARPRLGTWLALAVSFAVWLNPGWRRSCNQVMSDVPGVALILLGLLVERWADRAPSWRRDLVLGLCIGLSAHVRSLVALLVPAILARRVLDRARGADRPAWPRFARARLLAIAAVPLAVMLPWKIRDALHPPDPPVDQTSLYSYSTGMWHVDRGDPASPRLPLSEVLGRVPERARETLSTLGHRLRAGDASAVHLWIGAAALAIALVVLLRGNRTEGWLLLAVLAVGLVYFAFRDRLVLPLLVLALPAVAEAAARATRPIVAVVLVLLLAIADFAPRERWAEIEREHRAWEDLSARLAPILPADARVAVPSASGPMSIHLDRPVYTLLFGWQRRGGMEGAEEVIERHAIDTVVIVPWTEADRAMLPYFEERYPVIARAGDAVVLRVRPVPPRAPRR